MQLRSASHTDIGRIRPHNEDRLLCDDALRLYGVADGIGGLPSGEEAAQLAVEHVQFGIQHCHDSYHLTRIVRKVNEIVAKRGREISPTFGIGTTLTFGVFHEGYLDLAHVGDSRCYCLRDGSLVCLTTDHSVENEARAKAALGQPYWYNPAQRNALTRCIGQLGNLRVDTLYRRLQDGDRYLFCSDGVTKMVEEGEIAIELASAAEPGEILRALIALAYDRGGYDNASAVLVVVDKAD
ncbi:MAG: protein phosphatase 2C domain-containing protein [Opitutaceae bacterium]|jgi:protein phosphatase|nr:protein phosphatase 2C domain-containing protein [Opitutaceae bacterium]